MSSENNNNEVVKINLDNSESNTDVNVEVSVDTSPNVSTDVNVNVSNAEDNENNNETSEVNNTVEVNTVEENTVEEITVAENTVEENTVEENTVEENTVEENTVEEITVAENTVENNDEEKYDSELLDTTYDLLTSLVQGMDFNQNNWMLLLSKSMMLVSKNKKMKPIQKIKLSVDLVIKYLDDNTELEDKVLTFIRVNVRNMCESMVNNNKTKKKVKKEKVKLEKVDQDVVASPLQITNQLIGKIKNLFKSKNMNFEDLQKNIPEIVIMCINTFKKYKHLTNIEKKNLLIQTLTKFLKNELPKLIKMTKDQVESVNFIVDSIPNTIETLNNVIHGKDIKLDFRDPATQMMAMQLFMKLKPLFSCFKKED